MKKSLRLLLLQFFMVSLAFGQDFDNYRIMRSSGDIPQKFLVSSTEKYLKEVKTISSKEKSRVRRDKQQFFLESNFLIDELLLSGKVLFNDKASVYLNKVMDEILKDDPTLRAKIEVYVVRSPSVNAFTTNNGIIFVTMGLLSQLQDESQLAFILCHELTHYTKQHGLLGYIENKNIERGAGGYRNTSIEKKLLARSVYSKKNETEADLEGLELYLKSKYSIEPIKGVFDVLMYAHLPFDELVYKKEFLETEYLKFPNNYFLKDTKEIEAKDDEDSLGTHPGASGRKEAVMELLKDKKNDGRTIFRVSENDFNAVRKICRYELCNIYIQQRSYEKAFYCAYLLLNTNPNSKYLKTTIGKALYGLSKYYNAGRYSEVHGDYEKKEGNSQQVYYMFDKLDNKAIVPVSVRYLWGLHQQYPADSEILGITQNLFKEMVFKNYKKKSYFATEPKVIVDSTKAGALDTNKVSKKEIFSDTKADKYEKINKEKKRKETTKEPEKENTKVEKSFVKYAFVDLLKDTAFSKQYSRYVDQIPESESVKKNGKTIVFSDNNGNTTTIDHDALGLKKVVFVNPFYIKLNAFDKESRKYVASEASQKVFHGYIDELADKAGLRHMILDIKDLKTNATDEFNDIAVLSDYMEEKYAHEDMDFVNYLGADFKTLAAKYKTRYFCWTGMITIIDRNQYNSTKFFLLVTFPCIFPVFAYQALAPAHYTFYYNAIVDLQTGQLLSNNIKSYKFRDREDVVRSSMYDTFVKFKRKAKN